MRGKWGMWGIPHGGSPCSPVSPSDRGTPLFLWEEFEVGPTQIIARLLAAGCQLIPEGEQLRVRNPQKALTDELRTLIRQSKPAILDLLRQEHPVATGAGESSETPRRFTSELHEAMMPQTSHARLRRRASQAMTSPPPAHTPRSTEKIRSAQPEGDATLELSLDQVLQQFLDAQPEAWKREHIVIRFDRQVKAYLVRFAAPALEALCHFVASCTVFGSAAERDHYAVTLKWLIDHDVRRLAHTPYRPGDAPEVLPDQLPLFD